MAEVTREHYSEYLKKWFRYREDLPLSPPYGRTGR